MNIYIGNSIKDLNKSDRNVELSDDLLEFICKNRCIFDSDKFALQGIDPYSDTVIDNSELQCWLSMCDLIISSKILEKYEDLDEAKSIMDLDVLIHEAIINNLNLIIIGD